MYKKISMLTAALFCSAALLAQNTTLNVKLDNSKVGDKVGVILIDGYNYEKPLTEATLVNGEATLKFDIPAERGFILTINGSLTGETIALNTGENASIKGKEVKEGEYYRVHNVKVTGSSTHSEYLAKKLDRDALDRLHTEYNSTPFAKKLNNAYSKNDKAQIEALKATEGYKEYIKAEKKFFNTVDSTFKAVHKNNANSWLGAFMILTDYSYLTEEQKEEYDTLADDVKDSFYGKIIREKIFPPSLEGKTMDDFTFTDHNTGKKTSLKAVLKNSKYVLLDFWASWCRPCRAEIPNVKANYEKYHTKGFDVVSISADAKESEWLKALEQEKMPWPQDRDGKQGICALYKVQYYPTTYLLDSEGKVVVKDIRGEELGKKLEVLFR